VFYAVNIAFDFQFRNCSRKIRTNTAVALRFRVILAYFPELRFGKLRYQLSDVFLNPRFMRCGVPDVAFAAVLNSSITVNR